MPEVADLLGTSFAVSMTMAESVGTDSDASDGAAAEPTDEAWAWQDDGSAPSCSNPSCRQPFWLFRRRHHCRPCGRVFCRACCVRTPCGRRCRDCLRQQDPRLNCTADTIKRTELRRRALLEKEVRHRDPRGEDDAPELCRLRSRGPPHKVFRLGRRLGFGAFGEVLKARDERVGDHVAVKIITLAHRADQVAQRRQIANEVACHQLAVATWKADGDDAVRLPFPRLLSVFEHEPRGIRGMVNGPPSVWLVMECVEGDTLADFLRYEYPVPPTGQQAPAKPLTAKEAQKQLAGDTADDESAVRRARSIQTLDLTKMDAVEGSHHGRHSRGVADERIVAHFTQQLATALRHLHQQGIIFRDLKPDNIICETDPFNDRKTLRIVDFGGAIRTAAGSTVVDAQLVGSPAYIAPEAWAQEYSFGSDVWSLGCIVFEIAMGVAPFNCIADKVAELAARLPPVGTPERPQAVRELRARMQAAHSSMRVHMPRKGPQPRGVDSAWTTLCWSEEIVDFVGRCLEPSAARRWTSEELLAHPFLVRHARGASRSIQEVDVEVAYARLRRGVSANAAAAAVPRIGPSLMELRPGS
eukprot:TRINITY_DN6694_c0_g1_i1.p1 TRINITY_DN6694_c0_g1~~TRINITY_DN6694_c0_g1_i1.p1  ORF type:complete len:584 (+),score=111.79 TRINITY_DN6694_c0_g1_i1:104-1855(+)